MSQERECRKKRWNGCCCICQYHYPDHSHPWTDGMRIIHQRGWICGMPDCKNRMHSGWFEHGMCEMFTEKEGVEMEMSSFSDARIVFGWHLRHDDGLRLTYEANIAMLLHDRFGITNFEARNKAAHAILNLMFDDVGREPIVLAMAEELADDSVQEEQNR